MRQTSVPHDPADGIDFLIKPTTRQMNDDSPASDGSDSQGTDRPSGDGSNPPAHLKRNTIGGVIGNVLEWYDFAVFGYFAPIIGAHFFPAESQLASLINAFGVFAAGYLMRPLGGLIFGYIGDRMGRKQALQWSVLLMAIPTTMLGLLPTYAQIGVAASVLLVVLRLFQGLSVGGELIGSMSFITEIAPVNRRGLFGSWTLFSATCGVMLGSAVAAAAHWLLEPAALASWGWRLPFMAGLLVGGIGLWMRKGMAETPEFQQLKESGRVDKNPLLEAIQSTPTQIIRVGAMVALMGGGFYMLFVWWPTYLTKIVTPPVPHALVVNTIAMAVLMTLIPVAGWLSDRVGRKTVIVTSLMGFVLAGWPLFVLTDHGTFLAALCAQLAFALLLAGLQGPMPAAMVEMFPARTRLSGIGVGYNVSLAVFGGTAPLVSTWLVARTGDIVAPAYYLIFLAAVSLMAALGLMGLSRCKVVSVKEDVIEIDAFANSPVMDLKPCKTIVRK